MPKSQVDSVALVAGALTAALAFTLLLGPFAWMGSIVGLTLLLVLFGFDQEGYRTVLGSLAFSAVCGLSFAAACGAIFRLLAERGEVHLADQKWASEWLPFAFVFGTAFLWAIDRSRMSARAPVMDRLASRPGAQRSFINYAEPAPAPASPTPGRFVAPEVAPAPAYASAVAEPQHIYSQAPVAAPQVAPQPLYVPPPPPPQPLYAPPAVPQPTAPLTAPLESMLTATTSGPVRPAPAPIISSGGKETMIYINLLGEGLNVMRSVRSEHVGRDYYRIIDVMPEGENWQFQPGQVVRCKKQTLSTGKALVAVEEAPRAQ